MGAGASTDYASVAAALDDGHSQVNIERHLRSSCATEIEAINKAFGTDEDRPATAVACGRAAQRALDGLGFEINNMVFANSTSRDEFTREHHWWAYLEGRATDVVSSDKPCPTFDIGGLGGMLAAGKTGLELVASHALEQVGAIFLFFGPHVGCDADGRMGFVQDTPCSSAAAQAVEWAKKNKGATPKDSDDQQMDRVRAIALKHLEAIKDADAPPAAAPAPAEGEEEAAEPVVVEAPAKNGAVVMAEALYQATYEDVLRLVPKHLAQNRPVVLCGGINVITGPGKPDFFACKNFQVYSPREPDQPNDAFSSYRASLRALLFDPSAP